MRRLSTVTSFLRAFLRRSRVEREMDREMRFHVEARAADLQTQGLSAAEAMARARLEFGDVVRWKEASRDARGLRLTNDLGADVRYAFRMLRRSPGFTAAAAGSLALGLGATTAIFGIMDVLLLRPLPVQAPHQLVHVTTAGERGDAHSGSSNVPWFREVAARTDLFSDALLVRHDRYKAGIGGIVEPITGQRVSWNYFSMLGVAPVLGRVFTAADERQRVVVISSSLWHRRFHGSPEVLGQVIVLDQQPHTVIGVAPPQFGGLMVGWTMDLTMPLDPAEHMDPHSWSTMPLIARLHPGVDPAAAAAELDPVLQRFASTGVAERFRRRYLERVTLVSAARGLSDLRAEFGSPLRLLMGAVALLLLIACVNLAGLLVARNVTRQHELGMRLALGASQARLVRQLLTESAVLAVAGAVPGVLLAVSASDLLLRFVPPHFGPTSLAVGLDWRVLGFAFVATFTTICLFGLVPAWLAARHAACHGLAGATPRITPRRPYFGRALVVGEIAMALLLVAGAAMLLRTIVNLARVDPGFDRHHVIVASIDPQGTEYEGDRLSAFQRDMITVLEDLPGVQHVSVSTSSPFNGNQNGRRLTVPQVTPRDADDGVVQVNLVGPKYFEVLQLPIVRGRAIDERDREGTVPVVVVGESFARRYYGEAATALGQRFTIGGGESAVTHEIVGVAGEIRYQDLRRPSERVVYAPWAQAPDIGSTRFEFVLRCQGDPAVMIEPVRSAMQRFRGDVPILAIDTLAGVINNRLRSERLLATLGTFFGGVALVIAAIGVYGLLAHLVARRVPEIAVRLSLGARPLDMLWMTLREQLVLTGVGLTIGLAGAIAALRVLDGLLFGLAATDIGHLAGAATVLLVVSVGAAALPARRAAAVDPLVALRRD